MAGAKTPNGVVDKSGRDSGFGVDDIAADPFKVFTILAH
jgi:hypothetical protein